MFEIRLRSGPQQSVTVIQRCNHFSQAMTWLVAKLAEYTLPVDWWPADEECVIAARLPPPVCMTYEIARV